MGIYKRIFLSLFFTLSLIGCYPRTSNKVFDENIQSIMQKYDAIGVSVVLVKNNKIRYVRSFGFNPDYSNPLLRKKIRKDDVYWIASISKTFIATAIMQLVEKGKICLDDDVNNYFNFPIRNPSYPDVPITVRMLLCHMSSLNGEMVCTNFDMLSPQKNSDYKSFYTRFAPGTNYNYCNIGYNLAAAIIEKMSGMRFDEYLDKYILKPMKLYGGYDVTKLDSNRFVKTYSYNRTKKVYIKESTTYEYDKEKVDSYVLGYSVPCFWPPGGMKITISDLAKFMLMHMNNGKFGKNRIIGQSSEVEMRKVQNGRAYGLALAHYNNIIKDVELVGMTGGSRGIHSAMFFHPKEKYGFVVICNGCKSNSLNGIQMNGEVVNAMFNSFIAQ